MTGPERSGWHARPKAVAVDSAQAGGVTGS